MGRASIYRQQSFGITDIESRQTKSGEVVMAAKRDNTGRLIMRKLKILKKLGAKAAATRAEMSRVREEKAKWKTAMEEMKFEVDLLKTSIKQLSDDMLLISEAVDNLSEIILQLN